MRRTSALVLALLLVAAACGGSSGDGSSSTEPASGDGDSDQQSADGGVQGVAGGTPDQGLSQALGLPECPVGAHADAGEPVTIDFWHPYTAKTKEAMEDVTAAFNASQDQIEVRVQEQGSYEELLDKYRSSIEFEDLPGVAIFDAQAFRDIVDSGTVLPAQSCIEAEGVSLEAIDEQVRTHYSLDGALYPGTMNVSTPVLIYNRDHFTQAGLDPENPPGTLAEVQAASEAIAAAGVTPTPLSLLMQGWFSETWLTGAGVPLANADNGRTGNATEAVFDTPEAVEIYTVVAEMAEAGLINEFSNTPGQFGHYLAAAGEDASMLIETSTSATSIAAVLGGTGNLSELLGDAGVEGIDDLATTDLRLDIDVAPYPGLDAAGRVFISGGAYYMMDSGTDAERAAAWEFMKFLNELDQQKTIHLKGSYLPIMQEVVDDPEVQAIWENDAAGQWLATAHAQLGDIDPDFPGPALGPFTEQRDIFNASLEEVVVAGSDPATVVTESEAELTDALQQYADANF